MSLIYMLTAYCNECNRDLAESDSDDFDDLTQKMENRADYLYAEHIRMGQCR